MANVSSSDLVQLMERWWASSSVTTTASASIAALALAAYCYPSFTQDSKTIRHVGRLPLVTAWTFFSKRYDFLMSSFRETGSNIFKFNVLHHQVVALQGEEGRKVFFNDKSLDFTEGYRILMGGAPRLEEIDKAGEGTDDVSWFNKHLATLLRKERLADVLPTLFDDVNSDMVSWGREGKINPFENVYNLVFQMTVRMATCRELSENKEEVKRLGQLYNIMERSATPTALLLPWFPSRAKKTKQQATTDLYMKFNDYIDMRRKAVPSSDAFDVLIAEGCDNATIIGFTLGVIFAGVINTRVNSCWVLVYLAANPSWKSQVNEEVKQLLAKYSDESSGDKLHQRLSSIPVSAWEDEMPVLDLVIRETIRLTLTGAALRRNMEEDLYVEGKRIDRGAFMAYPLGSVHMNPEIYTEPSKFDPSRFTSGREEDKKGTFSYIGWGVGRHPCTGMKVAKLEMKLIVALFLAGYEYELVDAAGKFPDPFPQPDRNDISEARPLGDPCYLKFRRTVA